MKPSHKTDIDIATDSRSTLIDVLNESLAALSDLASQTKQAHWNVRGPYFSELHGFFDMLWADFAVHIDTVAERAVALGGRAKGTVRQAAEASPLPEFPDRQKGDLGFVEALIERYGATANLIRSNIDKAEELEDPTTADLFTQISGALDKKLWMLEAHCRS